MREREQDCYGAICYYTHVPLRFSEEEPRRALEGADGDVPTEPEEALVSAISPDRTSSAFRTE
jgi:hypothetical protein